MMLYLQYKLAITLSTLTYKMAVRMDNSAAIEFLIKS